MLCQHFCGLKHNTNKEKLLRSHFQLLHHGKFWGFDLNTIKIKQPNFFTDKSVSLSQLDFIKWQCLVHNKPPKNFELTNITNKCFKFIHSKKLQVTVSN